MMSTFPAQGASSEMPGSLTVQESLPLLQTLSKLYPVSVVKCSPMADCGGFPHFCFLVSREGKKALDFRSLRRALTKFDSAGEWFIMEDFPQLSVVVQPKNFASLPNTDAALRFRAQIVEEIPLASQFVERELHISGSPSLGLNLVPRDLSLFGIEDHQSPHFRNIYLIREPDRFEPSMGPTSEYDRILHYGLTEDEAFALTTSIESHGEHAYHILRRFYQPYKDQWVLNAEIPILREECLRIRETTSSAQVFEATEKILSICRSAAKYDLGVFIDSD